MSISLIHIKNYVKHIKCFVFPQITNKAHLFYLHAAMAGGTWEPTVKTPSSNLDTSVP